MSMALAPVIDDLQRARILEAVRRLEYRAIHGAGLFAICEALTMGPARLGRMLHQLCAEGLLRYQRGSGYSSVVDDAFYTTAVPVKPPADPPFGVTPIRTYQRGKLQYMEFP